jgi:hypothetical protein
MTDWLAYLLKERTISTSVMGSASSQYINPRRKVIKETDASRRGSRRWSNKRMKIEENIEIADIC